MIIDWVQKVLIVLLLFKPTTSLANDIYLNQIGDDVTVTITQDGENNKIGDLNNLSNKGLLGSLGPSTFSYTQTGNNNTLGIYNADIGDSSGSLTQTGDNNAAVMDCHGEDCTMGITQLGDNNDAHTEAGSSYNHNSNTITIYQKGDNNEAYAEADGDNNNLDSYQESDNNFSRVVVSGNNNAIKAWQGKHEDGTVDNDETGDNDVYWIVSGNNNTLESYQTDDNGNGGQHIANYITGDNNDVKHTQRGAGDHQGFIEINGDNNDVTLSQRGNTDDQFADIKLDDGHTVDVFQRYGSHTTNIDLTNAGGAYTLDLDQTGTTNKTYNLTGSCTNANGCGITIVQN
mgnify:CR=1 FL=1|tara:strand:- start:4968 stop:5999 length:1032 start_codon:yes stop_codon:yes gene_type:complete